MSEILAAVTNLVSSGSAIKVVLDIKLCSVNDRNFCILGYFSVLINLISRVKH